MRYIHVIFRLAAVGLSLLILSGCPGSRQIGDAVLIDHGVLSASRYKVDFGTIDLSRKELRTFAIHGLPNERFVFGFEVDSTEHELDKIRSSLSISLEIRSKGRALVDLAGSFDRWYMNTTRRDSIAFFYCCLGRDGPDSYLEADEKSEYVISVLSLSHDFDRPVVARLVAMGGGWK